MFRNSAGKWLGVGVCVFVSVNVCERCFVTVRVRGWV